MARTLPGEEGGLLSSGTSTVRGESFLSSFSELKMFDFAESLKDVLLLPEPLAPPAPPLLCRTVFFKCFLFEGLEPSGSGWTMKRPSGPLEMDSRALGEGA